jgi:hypothetical protein
LLYVLCEEVSAGKQSFEGCRRKYLQKQGGVRDMRDKRDRRCSGGLSLCAETQRRQAQASTSIGHGGEKLVTNLVLWLGREKKIWWMELQKDDLFSWERRAFGGG